MLFRSRTDNLRRLLREQKGNDVTEVLGFGELFAGELETGVGLDLLAERTHVYPKRGKVAPLAVSPHLVEDVVVNTVTI